MLCCNCFATDVAPDQPCPQCGFLSNVDTANYPMALTLGCILQERYIIGRPLGQGGFGITYLAWDNTLNAKVAIKEFLPESIAFRQRDGVSVTPFTSNREDDYLYGLSCFLAEAQTLAKFLQHQNIVGVLNFFEENGTAYFVMDYIEGLSLKTHLKNQGGTLPWAELCTLMLPVFDALESVHQAGLVHRDVTPDNIYLTGQGLVKLLDFSDLAHCPNLTHITISDPTFDGFQGLPLLEGIIYLNINGTQIKDLTPLENLPNLKYLYLYETEVEDLSPLSTLTKLENLNLYDCPIDDLSPLSDLPNLRELSFGGNDFITDLTPLATISSLRLLCMMGAQITDLTPLSSLVNLTSLELWTNKADDFTPLSSLTNLTTLTIGAYAGDSNSSMPLEFLVPLTNLTTLDLGAWFTDIQPLSHLTNLRVLALRSGTIPTLEPLGNLQQLTTLTLDWVDLHSDALVPLANLENLRILSIEGAPTNMDLAPVAHVPTVNIDYRNW